MVVVEDIGLLVLSRGVLQLRPHLTDISSLLVTTQVHHSSTSNHLPRLMANFLSLLQVVIPLAGSSDHLPLLRSLSSRHRLITTGSNPSRSIKPLRVLQLLPRHLLAMVATTNKAIIKVISNSLPRLLQVMVILLQVMANPLTLSKVMPNPCTVGTRMLSLLRVISKGLASKVMPDMDNLKLGIPPLQREEMDLLQQQVVLVVTITMQLRLEVLLLLLSVSLQL